MNYKLENALCALAQFRMDDDRESVIEIMSMFVRAQQSRDLYLCNVDCEQSNDTK